MDELDNIIEQKWAKIILIHNIMDTFHKIVIGVALLILLAMLIFIGVMLQRSKKNELYPPVATKCPDYWTEVENGCQENILNKGTLETEGASTVINFENRDEYDPNHEYAYLTDTCAKQKWALDNQIKWDGITNYNGCLA